MKPVEIAAHEYQVNHSFPMTNIIGAMLIHGNSDVNEDLVEQTRTLPLYRIPTDMKEGGDLMKKRIVFTRMLEDDSRQTIWEEDDEELLDFLSLARETIASNIDEANIDDWLESLNVYNLVFFEYECNDPIFPWKSYPCRYCAFTETL